jgi:hypothetical protein
MNPVRLILLGFFAFGAILQAPLSASAQEPPPSTPIVLPEGTWDVTATVTSKMADNLLEFGMSSPQDVKVCPQGEAADCAAGDTETIEGLTGELVFYLTDHSCSVTFLSTDENSAQVTQIDSTHWTIGWDDAGNCELRDGDDNDLVVSIVAHGADLSITKSDTDSDTDPNFGPDPVSSGGVIAYQIVVSNAGPDEATGVTVTDSATGGDVRSASGGDAWDCGEVSEGSVTCTLVDPLPSGEDAPDLTVLVDAPTTPTNLENGVSDTATVSANESDPNTGNNSDTEMTDVTGSNDASTKDHAQTFYDGTQEVTLQTTRDTGNGFYSKLVIPAGLQPGVVTIDEFPADGSEAIPGVSNPATFCGGRPCEFQIQVTVLPGGQTSPADPIHVFWFYTKGVGGNQLYVKGDAESVASLVKPCNTLGVANPAKCRNSVIRLPNKDRQYEMLWRDGGDPVGAKRS